MTLAPIPGQRAQGAAVLIPTQAAVWRLRDSNKASARDTPRAANDAGRQRRYRSPTGKQGHAGRAPIRVIAALCVFCGPLSPAHAMARR